MRLFGTLRADRIKAGDRANRVTANQGSTVLPSCTRISKRDVPYSGFFLGGKIFVDGENFAGSW